MSNQSGDGIADVRAKACDILLDHRLTQKAKDPKKAEAIMNKLHVAQPKKRDNKMREITIPDTVTRGVKKTGPTIKELQEEYGGAGNFYIPEEEHFLLENEDWRYDKWPEFYLGKNVADFYDAEIVAKLDALEKEEDEVLKMEAEKAEEIGQSSDEDGINAKDLAAAVKKVRGKINIIKQRHMMKSKTRAISKLRNLDEMTEELEKKGIKVNKESLATRVNNISRIGDLEEALEKKAKAELGYSDDSDDDSDDMMSDDETRKAEMENRGRRDRREQKRSDSAPKIDKNNNKLGKRTSSNRKHQDDLEMNSDDDDGGVRKEIRGSMGKMNRSMTPDQRKISVKKIIRDRTASRREGSKPQRLDIKPVPEEHIRLAKKINEVFKHKI
jgi:nucleolar GTP-binding protein